MARLVPADEEEQKPKKGARLVGEEGGTMSAVKDFVLGSDPMRQLALGSRAVAQGAVALPVMAGDAVNNLLNYGIKGINALGGSLPYIPSLSSTLDATLTKAGAPTPQSDAERLQYEISRGGAAGMTFPALMSHAAAPAMQGVSGILSGGVGQQAENMGASPTTSAILGGVAGMAIPSSPDALGVLGRGGRAAAQPFTAGGREEIVGNALARMATHPKTALLNMGAATDDVSRLTTAQAAKDPGLLSTERALASLPASGGRFATRYAEQNAARRALLEGMARTKDDLDAAKNARSAEAERLYEPAFNTGPIKPPEELIALAKRPAFEAAVKKAQQIAANEGLDLGDPSNTMRGLHYVKKGVDDLIEEAKPGTNEHRALTTVKRDLLNVMDNISPEYKAAREAYAKSSKPIEQMETLQGLRAKTLNTGLDVQGNRLLSHDKWTRNVMDNMDELRKTLSQRQIDNLLRITKDLDYGSLSMTGGKAAGSNTFQNLSVANVLGAALGKQAAESPTAQSLLRPLGFLYKLPERQVEELMIEAMLDRNLAMRLMSKATERNVHELAKGLEARMKASAKGSVAGQLPSE